MGRDGEVTAGGTFDAGTPIPRRRSSRRRLTSLNVSAVV